MGLTRRIPAGGGGGENETVTPTSVTNAIGLASSTQINQIKTYLNISGFDPTCYDLRAIQESPFNFNNKILDAGLDDV